MHLEIINNQNHNLHYTIDRISQKKVQIIEIKENVCDYFDFVLIRFMCWKQPEKEIMELIKQYRNKTVCMIGCGFVDLAYVDIYPDTNFVKAFDLYHGSIIDSNPEMLYSSDWNMTDSLFEDLIQSCLLTSSQSTHMDPQDWTFEKSPFDFYSKTGKSFNEAIDLIKERLDYVQTNIRDIVNKTAELKHKRAIISFFSNGCKTELELRLGNFIESLSAHLTKDCRIRWNFKDNDKSIKEGNYKVCILLGELV